MRKECFGQTGCYLSKCIHSIRKTVTTSSSSYISIEENIICIHRTPETVNTVTSSTSSRLCFSIKKQYRDVQMNNLRKLMAGMDEKYILNAIYMLRNENREYHEKIINILIKIWWIQSVLWRRYGFSKVRRIKRDIKRKWIGWIGQLSIKHG